MAGWPTQICPLTWSEHAVTARPEGGPCRHRDVLFWSDAEGPRAEGPQGGGPVAPVGGLSWRLPGAVRRGPTVTRATVAGTTVAGPARSADRGGAVLDGRDALVGLGLGDATCLDLSREVGLREPRSRLPSAGRWSRPVPWQRSSRTARGVPSSPPSGRRWARPASWSAWAVGRAGGSPYLASTTARAAFCAAVTLSVDTPSALASVALRLASCLARSAFDGAFEGFRRRRGGRRLRCIRCLGGGGGAATEQGHGKHAASDQVAYGLLHGGPPWSGVGITLWNPS